MPPLLPLEDDQEVTLEPEETIGERIKLITRKRKAIVPGLEILTPNKLLSRLPILLSQMNAGKNSYKLKNEMRQILHLLYQHHEITKKVYNNLIKS